jgi:hypothetical protein
MTYSSSLAMSRQRFASRNQNQTTFKAKEQAIGPVSNTIILIVLACLLGLLYLTQVTKTNAFSYKINDLKEKQTSLQSEHEQLVIDSARLQSLERVKNSEVANKLVQATPVATIQN